MLKIRIMLNLFLALSAFCLARAASGDNNSLPPKSYVGDTACHSCHQEKVDTYFRTAHHLTSQAADQNSILGKFADGENILKTSNPELFYRMEANERGHFQTAVSGVPPDTTSRTERFDLVIGSGGKGQTYLYWKGDELFQLPVTYWTELGQWVNSPGYRDGYPDFSRRVLPRCLDCHASHFESFAPPLNRYRNTGFELGISCEKCHGMGSEHVARQRSPDRFVCSVPRRHRRTQRPAVFLRPGRTVGEISRTAAPRSERQHRCTWQPGGVIEEEPLLPIFCRHDLLHLPQCPCRAARPRRIFGALSLLPQG